MAYCNVIILALLLYSSLLAKYALAASLDNGSSGLGSVNKELIDNNTLINVKAGLQLVFSISKQILPFLFILG